MALNIVLTQVALTSATTSNPIAIFPPMGLGNWSSGYLQPSILVQLSSGASLTYSVEVSGNDPDNPNYVEANAVWVGFTNMTGLTASAVATLGAMVKAVRLNCTAYTSGTLTMQIVQCIA